MLQLDADIKARYVVRCSVRSLAGTSHQTGDDKNDNYHGAKRSDDPG